MKKFSLRLISFSGEIRHEHVFGSNGGADLWRATTEAADRFGRLGEFLEVFDESGDMVIGVGVATARTPPATVRAAA